MKDPDKADHTNSSARTTDAIFCGYFVLYDRVLTSTSPARRCNPSRTRAQRCGTSLSFAMVAAPPTHSCLASQFLLPSPCSLLSRAASRWRHSQDYPPIPRAGLPPFP